MNNLQAIKSKIYEIRGQRTVLSHTYTVCFIETNNLIINDNEKRT